MIAGDTLPLCRECSSGPEPGSVACQCHPDATHRHYRRGRWTEYRGHAHDMIAVRYGPGRRTYCSHYCGRSGTYSDVPVTVRAYPRP